MLKPLKIIPLLLLLVVFALPVHAQSATSPAPTIPYAPNPIPSSVSPTSPLYTDLIVNNMFHTFSCLMTGSSVINQPCLTYQAQKNAQGALQTVPVLSQVNLSKGALGATAYLIGGMYANPPVRTSDYLNSVGQQLGIVQEAHAQVLGSGANVINPLVTLWQVSRNISYLAMIIVFVIIGVMVLFRNKINPQTVITAQAALPGLVIGLILITFSFFLSGVISDMAFVGTNLVGSYFDAARGAPPTGPTLLQSLDATYDSSFNAKSVAEGGRKANLISIFSKFGDLNSGSHNKLGIVVDSFWGDINDYMRNLLVIAASFFSAQIAGQSASFFRAVPDIGEGIIAIIQAISVAGTLAAPTGAISLLLGLTITAILMYVMVKLLIRMVNVYISIIFLTITAPFHFLAAALPGRQSIATGWFLSMLANALAFPAVIAVFYFVAFLLGPGNGGSFGPFKVADAGLTGSHLTPVAYAQGVGNQVTGIQAFPLFGGMDLDFIKILLAFGALLATPAIPDIVMRTVASASEAGQLIGQEISGSTREGRGHGQTVMGGFASGAENVGRSRSLFDESGYVFGEEGKVEKVGRNYQDTSADKSAMLRSGFRPGKFTKMFRRSDPKS